MPITTNITYALIEISKTLKLNKKYIMHANSLNIDYQLYPNRDVLCVNVYQLK